MKLLTKLKPRPVVIPEDMHEALLRSDVLNTFERRPKSVQKRHIRWVERATTVAERTERIRRVAGTMSRVAQYEQSRRRGWVGPTRTT